MKYITPIIAFFIFISCASKQVANENEILINSTSKVNVANDYEMKISKIISDSRCPENVTCVWAGEVQLEVEIYKKQKLEKSETLSINYKNLELNKQFFAFKVPFSVKEAPWYFLYFTKSFSDNFFNISVTEDAFVSSIPAIALVLTPFGETTDK